MKLKGQFAAVLIAFSLTFSLSAYSWPGDPNTHWQDSTRKHAISNSENADTKNRRDEVKIYSDQEKNHNRNYAFPDDLERCYPPSDCFGK